MNRKVDEDLPRMGLEPILYQPTRRKLVWAWMRWYPECAPGMLKHMLSPERFDGILKADGHPLTDENGEPWCFVTGDTPQEAFDIIGMKPSPELIANLNEQDAFHRGKRKK